MAKLLLRGEIAAVELLRPDPDDEDLILAKCVKHEAALGGLPTEGCGWSESYDTLDDAAEYAERHADFGRR